MIENELKEGCIELLTKIVKLSDRTRKAFEIFINAELESTAEATVDKCIIASGHKDNLWTKLLGMRVEELTTEVDSLKEKLSKYEVVEEDQGSEYFDNEDFIEISGICNQEEFPEVSVPKIVKQPVITNKRNRHLMFGYVEAERKRKTRLAKRMKAQINAQWKVIRGVKEQLAHVVKEQKRKTEQRKELDKTKEIEQM